MKQALAILVLLVSGVAGLNAQTTAMDLDGKPFDPLSASPSKTTVLVFVRKDCPISARYAPEIERLSEQYRKNAQFYLVFPDKTESAAEIHKYLHDFAYTVPALRDPGHALVHRASAQVTPEAAVFDAKGALVYHGRIDNLYQDIARKRPQATTHELDDALRSATQGVPLLARETRAVGCCISDLP